MSEQHADVEKRVFFNILVKRIEWGIGSFRTPVNS